MSYARPQRHRKDENQPELVKLFESLGGYWVPYANKPFDGWARHARFGYMPVELKLATRDGHANEYTPRQKKLMQEMEAHGAPWLVWRTPEDIYQAIGVRRAA
jgi:hypothetical protein